MRQTIAGAGALVLGAALLGACSEGNAQPGGGADGGDTDSDTAGGGPTGLLVTPPDAQLTVENGVSATLEYTVIAQYDDGHTEDVTDLAELSIDPGLLGVFDDNALTTSDTHGGVGTITATLGEAGGQTTCTIDLHTVHVADGAPSGVEEMFDGADDPARAPVLRYPLDGALLPPNLSDVDVQWEPGSGNDVWRLTFEGAHLAVEVYTDEPSFVPTELLWDQVSWGNAGGAPVSLAVAGTAAADPSTHGVSEPVEIAFAEQAVTGGIYYWAASSTVQSDYGIFRYDFGEPGQQAEQVYTTAQTDGRCVACHALSRDGTRMALNYDGGDGPADIIDVATQTSVVAPENAYYANFHTYSPDDAYVLSVYQGIFTLRDGATGAAVETLPLDHVTYPDWSADGSLVAFTRVTRDTTPDYSCDWSFHGGQIELMTYGGPGVWGEPEVLVPAQEDLNFYYPAISPDGDWVVYNRSSELGAYESPGDSYSDDDAELWVISVDGGAPIRLDAVNLDGDFRTSWAKWAPNVDSYQGEPLLWLTVSSMRGYGTTLADGQLPQIWMAAFSPSAAADGVDPTWSAFYLPFQDITTNNHIAQWTEVVVDYE